MRRIRLLSLFVVFGLLVAACGDDDDTSTATDDTVEGVDENQEDGADADEVDDETVEAMGECGFLTGFATAFEDFDPSTMFAAGEPTDFGELFAPLAEATQDVADSAPEEIQDAFRTIADGFSTIADELEGVVIDLSDPDSMDPEAMATLENLQSSFGDGFDDASAEIEAWVEDNCAELADAFDLDAFGG